MKTDLNAKTDPILKTGPISKTDPISETGPSFENRPDVKPNPNPINIQPKTDPTKNYTIRKSLMTIIHLFYSILKMPDKNNFMDLKKMFI